jgi:hypothetical protein
VTASITSRAKGFLGRVFSTLFFGVFLAMGLFFLVVMARDFLGTTATYGWKEVPATILSSAVKEEKKRDEPFTVAVSFRYQWEGRSYTSDRYQTSPYSKDDYSKVQGVIAGLPTGTVTVCYVDPQDPSQAVLRRKSLGMAFLLLLPLVFVAVGAGGIVGTWIQFSSRPRPQSAENEGGNRWIVLLAGFVFAAVGLAFLMLWYLPTLSRSLASSGWTETPCTVISSRVKSHRSKDGTTYSVDVFYRYQVNGKEFKSNTYRMFGGSSSGYKPKAKIVAEHPAGAKKVCYVNPKNPAEAVLKPGLSWEVLLGLLPLAFLSIGIYLLFVARRMVVAPSDLSPERLSPPLPVETEAAPLKAQGPPLARFFGILIFALFWNGVVALFVWDVVDGFRSGSPDWFLTLFMTPFVAIGLGSIGMLGYTALALTNPRCRLDVSPTRLRPGLTPEVTWTLTGATGRVRRLRIILEGREEAVYRRGTSNCTDRHTFARIPVVDVAGGLEIVQGSARFRVPDGVPPSFQTTHNKIIWSFRVHGEIARWPDVLEEFEVTVGGGKS